MTSTSTQFIIQKQKDLIIIELYKKLILLFLYRSNKWTVLKHGYLSPMCENVYRGHMLMLKVSVPTLATHTTEIGDTGPIQINICHLRNNGNLYKFSYKVLSTNGISLPVCRHFSYKWFLL